MKQNGLIIGLILACLLGTVWVTVAATTGFLTGIWSIAFGLAVGLCFRFCCGASGLPASALSAALVAVVVVFAAGWFAPRDEQPRKTVEENLTDEAMVVSTALQLAEEWTMEGRKIEWPQGVDQTTASKQSDFPPTLWQAASRQWTMTPPAVKARCLERRKANLQTTHTDDPVIGFDWMWSVAFAALAGVVAAATCALGSD